MALKIFFSLLVLVFSTAQAETGLYSCTLKTHCNELGTDKKTTFEYLAGTSSKEAMTVDLGVVRARVYGPHYLSLYLFDIRHANNIWTKTHSSVLIEDLEVSLVIPDSADHSMVANLFCSKKH